MVYRARREADGLTVILKTLAADPADLAALRREYELLRGLDAGGVVRPLDLVGSADRLALVLEDVPGKRLKSLIPSDGMDVGLCLRLAGRLARVLGDVHRAGLVHKDVTPNNVLVDPAAHDLCLIDFSLASRRLTERQTLAHPSVLEGTLAYVSPEQTGRMNRDVDYRTDFYSFGVVLYEMLTGRLPFDSPDPLEVVHGHIARTARTPVEVRADVPAAVSAVVMKLLAKAAEDRYQSARGLVRDLDRCAEAWEATGRVDGVEVGREDLRDRFVIPQRLYGRGDETAALLAAFDRVAAGGAEVMMVGGYAGIGKTSLIRELYRPIVARRGYFIAGKFDQIVQVPFGALIQAFQGLVQQLLTEGERQLGVWRARLAGALGPSAPVLAEVIPELMLLLGPQEPVPPLDPSASRQRFRLAFQDLVRALARPEHPLVVFLDDLQ